MAKIYLVDGSGCSIDLNRSGIVVALRETHFVADLYDTISIAITTSEDEFDPGIIIVDDGMNSSKLYEMHELDLAVEAFLRLVQNLTKDM
jgi:hypothetical protein